jgi:HlyD family secretion protein
MKVAKIRLPICVLSALFAATAIVSADEKTETHTVKKGPLKIEVALEGTFEPEAATEVILRCQEWTDLSVLSVVEHGAAVKQGDTLLELDRRTIDEAIRDLESSVKVAQIGLAQAEVELKLLDPTVSLDLAAAKRAKERADADLKEFVEVQRDVTRRKAEAQVKMALNGLNYQQDELQQLEKMYKADDLTEETEEIVVKRQRDSVEMAKENLALETIERDQTLKVTLPRQEEALKEAAARTAIELTRTEATLSHSKDKKMLELQALREGLERSKRKLARLQHDRELMKVTAAGDGVVYYGAFVRGQWIGGPDTATKLRRGGNVVSDEVLMTVVQPRSQTMRVAVAEKDLRQVKQGAAGFVAVNAFPATPLAAKVEAVSAVPISPGKLSATIKLTAPPADGVAIAPGLSGTFKLVGYSKSDALAVPLAALQTEENDPTKQYVTIIANDKEEKRPVKAGQRNDTLVEILEGLKEGEVIKTTAKTM